jgi:hypothetical protein
MKQCACLVFLIIVFTMSAFSQARNPVNTYDPSAAPNRGLRPYQPRGLYQDTWYDALLSRLNPEHRNWGDWIEQRRQAFLDAYLRNTYFKYSFVVTLLLLLLSVGANARFLYDLSKKDWICTEKLKDAQDHDRRSRAAAHDAIRQYNEHMEKCNRAIEAQQAGLAVAASTAGSDAEAFHAELEETRKNLDDVTRERDQLKDELDRVKFTIADLSLKVNSLAGKGNGEAPSAQAAADGNSPSRAEMMRHIANLQEQVYAERARNKNLKGG